MNQGLAKNLFLTDGKFFTIVSILLAISLAFLIVSGNYMALFLFVGTLGGLFLFANPVYCFWILFFSVFLMGGIISHFPQITTLRWGIVLLSLMLGLRTVAEFAVPGKGRAEVKLDRLLLLVAAFIFTGIASSLINRISPVNMAVALKNYFQFIPVAFALAILPQFKQRSIAKKIVIGLLIVAVIQVPAALYQRFVLGPQFIATYGKLIAVNDAICGTFANSLRGGASKALSLYLLFVSGMLVSFAKHKILSWRKALIVSLFLMVPIIFNETKVSFVYIPVLFAVIFRKELLSFGLKGIISLVACLAIIAGLGYAYKAVYTKSDLEFEKYVKQSLEYNFGTRGYGRYDLNRLTVLTFWIKERKHYDFLSLLTGHGLDATNEAEDGLFGEKGSMAARYPFYGIGLTMVSKLLWETGVLGMTCFLAIIITAFKRISRYRQNLAIQANVFQQAILLGLQAGLALCFIESFVSQAFRTQEVYNFLFSLILGLTLMMTQTHVKQ